MIYSYMEQIQDLAESAGITVKQAFELAGVHHSIYYRVINNQRPDIHIATANKLCEAIVNEKRRTGTV